MIFIEGFKLFVFNEFVVVDVVCIFLLGLVVMFIVSFFFRLIVDEWGLFCV